jgi:hypothetical protein
MEYINVFKGKEDDLQISEGLTPFKTKQEAINEAIYYVSTQGWSYIATLSTDEKLTKEISDKTAIVENSDCEGECWGKQDRETGLYNGEACPACDLTNEAKKPVKTYDVKIVESMFDNMYQALKPMETL